MSKTFCETSQPWLSCVLFFLIENGLRELMKLGVKWVFIKEAKKTVNFIKIFHDEHLSLF